MYLQADPVLGFSGLFDWYYGTDKLKKQGAELDKQLEDLNNKARSEGTIDEATYQQMVANLAQQIQDENDVPPDFDQAWIERAASAYHSTLSLIESIPELYGRVYGDLFRAVGKGVGKGVSTAAKGAAEGALSAAGGVPWWLWIVGAGALFVYLGGGKVVDYQARKRISRYAR